MVRVAMRAHAAMGNLAAVVRQYELCVQALREEYGTRPSPQTVELYTALSKPRRGQKPGGGPS
jgi:DNA-binding SARP family transcriptional activator